MKIIEVNGLRVRGNVNVNSSLAVPRFKGSISEVVYSVGYYKGDNYFSVHEFDDFELMELFKDAFKQKYPHYTCVCLKISQKVSKL